MKKIIVLHTTIFILFFGITLSWGQQTISEEAKRNNDRGMAAVEMAKSPEDYAAAIKEFEQAVKIAPDWPVAYYNLGRVQEKAEKYSDAITNLKQYLRLVPNASDAETVKSLINKLEYKQEQEDGVKRVYEIMVSGLYEKGFPVGEEKMSGDEWLHMVGDVSLRDFRMVSGEMQVKRLESVYDPDFEYHPELHPPTRKWNPVKVNGRFYEYAHSSYMDVSTGYVVRTDYEVKGEIISIDPPRVKEITKISVTWGAPIPGDQNSQGRPWSGNYGATTECVFEWKAKDASINAKGSLSNTPLHGAAISGQKEEAELLIAKGADVNAKDSAGRTPLHNAIIGDTIENSVLQNEEAVELLIAKGADVNARDKNQWTPLHYAAFYACQKDAELLIAKGADINAKNKDGETPLHRAVQSDQKEVAELLIAKGADINAKNNNGDTPLEVAAFLGSKEVAELLIAKGADVNAKNKDGYTPLDIAVFGGGKEVAELLIAKGADINAKNKDGETPLELAVSGGRKEVAELLIAKGADVSAKATSGKTPLHDAAFLGSKEVAELLIAKGADINAKNKDGETPLHRAVQSDQKEVAELLIAKGADINAKNNNGDTPLEVAAFLGSKEVAELLIAKGADVNAKNKDGYTPLDIAVFGGGKEVAELLIAKGADINAKNKDGSTPLHMAVTYNSKEVAELLIAKGADINAKNKDGETPLELAVSGGRKEVVELLIALGADVNAKNKDGYTPLDIAVSEEAKRHNDRGITAVEMAKSLADYEPAIKEFEQAVKLAPDWPVAYYNLGRVQEKVEKYSNAITNLKQYLRLAPNASDTETVKTLINKLEYKKENVLSVSEVTDVLVSYSSDAKLPFANRKWKESLRPPATRWLENPAWDIITREGDSSVRVVKSRVFPYLVEPGVKVQTGDPVEYYQTVKVEGRILRFSMTALSSIANIASFFVGSFS